LQPGDVGFDRMKPLMDDIEAWVEEFKRKDMGGRDKGLDNAEIADRIVGTMQHDPGAWFASDNPKGLLAYLKEHNPAALEQIFGLTSLSGGRTSQLLEAVLDAWVEVIGPRLQEASMEQINAALK
jgi:hypothetical protein